MKVDKRSTRTDIRISMKDCPYKHGTREYKTEYTRRRRAAFKQAGLTVHGTKPKDMGRPSKSNPRRPKKLTDDIYKVPPVNKTGSTKIPNSCCICGTEIDRDADEKILNGTMFSNTTRDGRIVRTFACEVCL